jgi:hypothetical protein
MNSKIIVAALIAASLTGCANLTPEQNAALGAGLVGAAAVGAAYAGARYSQPVYVQQPVYVVPVRRYNPYCWRSAVTGQWVGCTQ